MRALLRSPHPKRRKNVPRLRRIRARINYLTKLYVLAYYTFMRPIEHIRKQVFGVSQAVFGEIAGTTQASVSRWESGELEPGRDEMARIRAEAQIRKLPLDDSMFFETPGQAA